MVHPRVLTKNRITSVVLPQSACGRNWFMTVNVRNAYQGWDKHARILPSLGEKSQVAAREEGLIKQFDDERKRVVSLRSEHKAVLTSSQKSNIDKYLKRAKEYLEDAGSIETGWRGGFMAINYGPVAPFSISIEYGDIGNGFCIGKYGHKSTNIYEPNCPTQDEMIGHNLDADKWTSLMMGAVLNIRCSEEVIRKAEIKEANKQSKPKTGTIVPGALKPKLGGLLGVNPTIPAPVPHPIPGGISMTPAPGAPTPMPMPTIPVEPMTASVQLNEPPIAPDEDVEEEELFDEEEGVGVLEEEDEFEVDEAPAPKKKKKKSSVPLVAAAGLGALLLLR